MPAGRPTLYTPEIVEKAKNYINGEYKDLGHTHPSVVGLACHLNLNRSTLYDWAEHENNEFSYILPMCLQFGEFHLLNGGLKGELNSNIVKLALGKYGYSDKQDNTLSGPDGGPVEHDHTMQVEFIGVEGPVT